MPQITVATSDDAPQVVQPGELQIGDVIQIHPKVKAFGGCIAIVDEPKRFGAQVYVLTPANPVATLAPFRVNNEDMVRIGHACWRQQ